MASARCCGKDTWKCTCGMSFHEKLSTVTLNRASFDTATLKNYYDSEPVEAIFGKDAKEALMEETQGTGYVRKIGDDLYHRNYRTGDVEKIDPEMALQGPEEDG